MLLVAPGEEERGHKLEHVHREGPTAQGLLVEQVDVGDQREDLANALKLGDQLWRVVLEVVPIVLLPLLDLLKHRLQVEAMCSQSLPAGVDGAT